MREGVTEADKEDADSEGGEGGAVDTGSHRDPDSGC